MGNERAPKNEWHKELDKIFGEVNPLHKALRLGVDILELFGDGGVSSNYHRENRGGFIFKYKQNRINFRDTLKLLPEKNQSLALEAIKTIHKKPHWTIEISPLPFADSHVMVTAPSNGWSNIYYNNDDITSLSSEERKFPEFTDNAEVKRLHQTYGKVFFRRNGDAITITNSHREEINKVNVSDPLGSFVVDTLQTKAMQKDLDTRRLAEVLEHVASCYREKKPLSAYTPATSAPPYSNIQESSSPLQPSNTLSGRHSLQSTSSVKHDSKKQPKNYHR